MNMQLIGALFCRLEIIIESKHIIVQAGLFIETLVQEGANKQPIDKDICISVDIGSCAQNIGQIECTVKIARVFWR